MKSFKEFTKIDEMQVDPSQLQSNYPEGLTHHDSVVDRYNKGFDDAYINEICDLAHRILDESEDPYYQHKLHNKLRRYMELRAQLESSSDWQSWSQKMFGDQIIGRSGEDEDMDPPHDEFSDTTLFGRGI